MVSVNIVLMIGPSHSWRPYCSELADCYQQRVFLYKLGHNCLHQLALPLRAQGPERPAIYRDVWVEVHILAHSTSLAHVGFPYVAGLLCWMRCEARGRS